MLRTGVTIRSLTVDEWHVWRTVRLAALTEAPDAYSSTLAEWTGAGDSELRWRQRLASVPYNVVAVVDGEPAGLASGTTPEDGCIDLISMWVAPHARGRGVGDALIAAVADWGRRNGVQRIGLDVMHANDHARRLYERNGFRATDAPTTQATCELRMVRDL